jgi:hypothetical protein
MNAVKLGMHICAEELDALQGLLQINWLRKFTRKPLLKNRKCEDLADDALVLNRVE